MRAALQFVLSTEIPSEHKAVLIEVLTDAMRQHDARIVQRDAALDSVEPWQVAETAQVESFLRGKIARSWQHADELLMNLAAQLHRNPNYVRSKATELGFGEGVDYRLAKIRAGQVES
jgi:hypothetical protein